MAKSPLAERMRPKRLEEYIGQNHILGQDASLRKSLEKDILPSLILWGPPGSGKTTLASLLAEHLNRNFYPISAINSGVKEVREIIDKISNSNLFHKKGSVLFIDEIHRFSKSQQDSLLGAVEKGTITLIGATTENPSFEVISALLSRCQVYTLNPHSEAELSQILKRALTHDKELQNFQIELAETNQLFRISGGDARKLLNVFEFIVHTFGSSDNIKITDEYVAKNAVSSLAKYDKDGEQHYDIISAFIKSIRGSDVNASIYWLARLIEGGEDPKFIARRLIILSAEDIGIANPNALLIANNCFQAVEKIGFPESRIILSQCAIYLAASPKGNSAYMAINEAQNEVKRTGDLMVPLALRNAPTKLMKELGYGEEYMYSHHFSGNFVEQEFMPKELIGKNFFTPGSSSKEKEIQERMNILWKDKYKTK